MCILTRAVTEGRGNRDLQCADDCARNLVHGDGLAGSTAGSVNIVRTTDVEENEKSLKELSNNLFRAYKYDSDDDVNAIATSLELS